MLKHIPIGYKLVDGKIEVDRERAKVIRKIFTDYLKGSSMKKIAEDLSKRGFLNKNNKPNWYHGSIGRILEDSKYLGDEIYLQIIDRETFQAVKEKRREKNKHYARTKEDIRERNESAFIEKLVCGQCGELYRKYTTDIKKSKEETVWKCHNHTYQRKMKCNNLILDESELEDEFIASVNYLISRMWILERNKKKKKSRTNMEIRSLEERIKELEEKGLQSSKELSSLIFKRARAYYDISQIDDYDYMTEKIKEELRDREKLIEFDGELFEKIIDKIRIYKDGNIEVEFINGIILEEDYK